MRISRRRSCRTRELERLHSIQKQKLASFRSRVPESNQLSAGAYGRGGGVGRGLGVGVDLGVALAVALAKL